MHNPYLLLWLEAPLQAWGADSKFGRRESQAFPTKSGILGLLCSALGAGGEQRELLEEFANLDQTVLSFVRTKEIRGDLVKQTREPALRDFHMVGSGYDKQDPWASMLIPKTSDDKPAVGGGAKMTYRYYLQDAAFAVVIEVPIGRSVQIIEALQAPTWAVYLGRKNCVPTDLIYRGCFTDKAQALNQAELISRDKNRIEDFRVLNGALADGDADEIFTLNDVPVQFGEDKRYRDRQVSLIYA
ncbi:MAG: type I-E CRISPR-associated protein Cas5/CasD [Polynucleobacter sp.]|uniref:type I-E CRISPR-associated protein Cas5/CasD n=1 Tax=Polynucleobacter sp. TaxID=2029855 RepID=UPI00271BDFA0|nr:type I-E CRISPR-associated protein Cas5/CasD [Polynucleobacter sp.]MDO8714011.1 type I-E CRISPR-associated protein Cas5/CasD [Polynucleobacter sp.]